MPSGVKRQNPHLIHLAQILTYYPVQSSSSSLLPSAPRVLALSFPFLIDMMHPCSLSFFASALLATIPGNSFALYTWNISVLISVRIGKCRRMAARVGSIIMSVNFNRNAPGVRQERSEKQKKQPSSPRSSSPTKGVPTNDPMSRRWWLYSSGMYDASRVPDSSQMEQFIT